MKKDKVLSITGKVCFALINVILFIYVLSLIVPIIWMIFTAFKSYPEYYENAFWWPEKWYFENFPNAFEKLKITVLKGKQMIQYDVFSMFFNSLLWAFGRSFVAVLEMVICAYVIGRYRFKFCEALYAVGIFVMITPIIGAGPSAMVLRRALGIYDNMFLMILTTGSCAFSGFNFILLYGTFKNLPKSYEEAASIDGAGPWTILFKVMFPLMLPITTVIFILSFLGNWNDYSTFLIWLPSYPNLAYGVYQFQNDAVTYGATINEVMAGFSIIMIPTMILYLASNKLITSKFTVGGLKG